MKFEDWWKTVGKSFEEGNLSDFEEAVKLIAESAWDAGYNVGYDHGEAAGFESGYCNGNGCSHD